MTKAINPAAKRRSIDKPGVQPYATWTDSYGQRNALLKSHQVDNAQPYARWHMAVDGDRGDSYVRDHLRDLVLAKDLVFDTNIWPSRDAFLAWVRGAKVDVKPGDTVRITTRQATSYGVVKTAKNYGSSGNDDWYITLTDPDHGPVYWKQQQDGGAVEVIK